jgi:endonuclease/exonuclease/phosphatase family metal-dependent hydrolase
MAADLGTYANGSKRLDWILVSHDLRFATFEVRPETVSDHHAIVAVIEPAVPATTGSAPR